MGHQLPEMPFITMLYVLLNCSDGTVTFARAGHPHPMHLPREGQPSFWACEGGGLLGVFVTQYREQTQTLRAGDKLLLYTDGLETGTGESGGGETIKLLKACALEHRALPIQEYVPRVANDLLAQVKQADDFTLLGVEMG
jgi:sigma-B regulation protein RsbU (phosphoserine phosphatase)